MRRRARGRRRGARPSRRLARWPRRSARSRRGRVWPPPKGWRGAGGGRGTATSASGRTCWGGAPTSSPRRRARARRRCGASYATAISRGRRGACCAPRRRPRWRVGCCRNGSAASAARMGERLEWTRSRLARRRSLRGTCPTVLTGWRLGAGAEAREAERAAAEAEAAVRTTRSRSSACPRCTAPRLGNCRLARRWPRSRRGRRRRSRDRARLERHTTRSSPLTAVGRGLQR
mmetsp:Transcript_43082/g.143468  ORF Transcript_43082/g.143468 Transcript_43082/m.143468 type:complete len:232 (+) Transcript_43082:160-855(+)